MIMNTEHTVLRNSNNMVFDELIQLVNLFTSVGYLETMCTNVNVEMNDTEGVERVKQLIQTRVKPLVDLMMEYHEWDFDFRELNDL